MSLIKHHLIVLGTSEEVLRNVSRDFKYKLVSDPDVILYAEDYTEVSKDVAISEYRLTEDLITRHYGPKLYCAYDYKLLTNPDGIIRGFTSMQQHALDDAGSWNDDYADEVFCNELCQLKEFGTLF